MVTTDENALCHCCGHRRWVHQSEDPFACYAAGEQCLCHGFTAFESTKGPPRPLQVRVGQWGEAVFGVMYLAEGRERSLRALEECLELVQSVGCVSLLDVLSLTSHVFKRDPGEVHQEVAGAMLTLLALSEALGIDAEAAAEQELASLNTPERIAKVRARQHEKAAAGIGAKIEHE